MPLIMSSHAPFLRGIAEALGMDNVSTAARKPGITTLYRVTVHYADKRASDAVTTLIRAAGENFTIQTMFARLRGKPILHPYSRERFLQFAEALTSVRFDALSDQPNLPDYINSDLWLIERASGTFARGIIVAPLRNPQEGWARLINAVKKGIPEALREVT